MNPVLFDQDDPRDRGRAHGEMWREEIRELAELRTELTIRRAGYASEDQLCRVAASHLPVMRDCTPGLHDELLGIAEGARLPATTVVVLNHYTDLRDLSPSILDGEGDTSRQKLGPSTPSQDGSDPDGCTAIYVGRGPDGPLLGQTWDMHATAEPFVRMIRIKPRSGDDEVLCFTLTGCLGMAGLGRHGVAVTINNLTCTDARIGLVWPALVRTLLGQPDAARAYGVLRATPLTSGHHYTITDGLEFYGVECSGELKVLTQKGARAAHLHTNHCFDPVLRQRERIGPGSTTFDRMNMATTLYAQLRPNTVDGVWDLLGSHEGYPKSICSHMSDASGDPGSSKTCGRILMQPTRGRIRAAAGCSKTGAAVDLEIERFVPREEETP